jgi:hypothetical protein
MRNGAEEKKKPGDDGKSAGGGTTDQASRSEPQQEMEARTEEEVKPGVYLNVPFEEYKQIKALSSHEIIALLQSPGHYKAAKEGDADTPAMAFGRAFHVAMEGADVFDRVYAVGPEGADGRSKVFKEAKAAAEAEGREILTFADAQTIEQMKAAVLRHEHARVPAIAGHNEVTIIWRDEETGILFKARIDKLCLEYGLICDYKSTKSTDEHNFTRDIALYDLHVQAAQYLAAVNAFYPKTPWRFAWIAVEKVPYYDCALFFENKRMLEVGERRRRNGIKRYVAELQAGGEFSSPRYPRLRIVSLPSWALR